MSDTTTPSTTAIIISTAILASITGYMIGIFSSLGFLPIPFLPSNALPNTYESEEESEAEDIDEDETPLDHAPNWGNGLVQDEKDGLRMRAAGREDKAVNPESRGKDENYKKGEVKGKGDKEVPQKLEVSKAVPGEECKLILVVRTDLGMTKGKIAAQASHATLACYKKSLSTKNPHLRSWETSGQAKIAVKIESEEELFTLLAKARSLGLIAEMIADAGRTQIASGSYTVVGIGPAPKSVIDAVTGGLKLL